MRNNIKIIFLTKAVRKMNINIPGGMRAHPYQGYSVPTSRADTETKAARAGRLDKPLQNSDNAFESGSEDVFFRIIFRSS